MPRYPVYIPSKGRFEKGYTAEVFARDGVPFWLVVEPQEADAYREVWGEDRVLVLPWDDPGSVIPARNWIRDHAESEGHARHWQFDDNIRAFYRFYRKQRVYVRSGVAIAVCEDFTDRYENVGISGFNYSMFTPEQAARPPFVANVHVYSACLINHEMPHRWRGRYNEDTDLCLQALATGWATIQMMAFTVDKLPTMTRKGGNTDVLYGGDGRLKMARALEKNWPGIVKVTRRFGRPQHVVNWGHFADVPLRKREGVEIPDESDEYGMTVTAVAEPQSERMRRLFDER
jgi:hypothetical protein